MAKQQDEPKILLDADVVIHFLKAGYQMKLTTIFPDRLVILDKVKHELVKRKSEALGIENFISWSKIKVEPMPIIPFIISEVYAVWSRSGLYKKTCPTAKSIIYALFRKAVNLFAFFFYWL